MTDRSVRSRFAVAWAGAALSVVVFPSPVVIAASGGAYHTQAVTGRLLAKGVMGTPRLRSGGTAAVLGRINAALTRADARVVRGIRQCRSDAADDPVSSRGTKWTRRVRVTFAGPLFFAVHIEDSFYCGGAYPSAEDQVLVFDLRSGRPVDWTPMLPAAYRRPGTTHSAADGSTLGVFTFGGKLGELFDPIDRECRGELPYAYVTVWPDRSTGSLILGLRGFAHATQSCEEDVGLKPDQLKRLGFDRTLTAALAQPPGRGSP